MDSTSLTGPLMSAKQKRIVGICVKEPVTVDVSLDREFVDAGGLMSYGADLADSYRRVANYVDRIFKGAKPAELPVEQPTKFEMVINLENGEADRPDDSAEGAGDERIG